MPRTTLVGLALCAVALVTTVWLAATGNLILYIHPRYVVFTLVMAVIGLVFVIASLVRRPEHEDEPARPTKRRRMLAAAGGIVTLVIALAMVIVPPATLSQATVAQRSMNAGSGESGSASAASVKASGASSKFSVLEWVSLLRQTTSAAYYSDKPVDVTGFVSADTGDPDDMFYVSRFVITCCAVDAQPVGVPVYDPGWAQTYKADDWVRVTGTFLANPSTTSTEQLAVVPTAVVAVSKPKDPYLF